MIIKHIKNGRVTIDHVAADGVAELIDKANKAATSTGIRHFGFAWTQRKRFTCSFIFPPPPRSALSSGLHWHMVIPHTPIDEVTFKAVVLPALAEEFSFSNSNTPVMPPSPSKVCK
jgi:hypothetical protein